MLEVHWTPDGERLVSCSPDKTVRAAGWHGAGAEWEPAAAAVTGATTATCPMARLALSLLMLPAAGAGVGRGDGGAGEEDGGAQGHRQQVGAGAGRVERWPWHAMPLGLACVAAGGF